MYYVYILKSIKFDKLYIGQTENLKQRLEEHNSGKSKYSSKYKPWTVAGYYAFISKPKAIGFEKYLKTASGKAFTRKRLIQL